jgi:hypothetical protein
MRLEPGPPSRHNDFHEVWWDSAAYVVPKERPYRQLFTRCGNGWEKQRIEGAARLL